jgi:hypothetical protein
MRGQMLKPINSLILNKSRYTVSRNPSLAPPKWDCFGRQSVICSGEIGCTATGKFFLCGIACVHPRGPCPYNHNIKKLIDIGDRLTLSREAGGRLFLSEVSERPRLSAEFDRGITRATTASGKTPISSHFPRHFSLTPWELSQVPEPFSPWAGGQIGDKLRAKDDFSPQGGTLFGAITGRTFNKERGNERRTERCPSIHQKTVCTTRSEGLTVTERP